MGAGEVADDLGAYGLQSFRSGEHELMALASDPKRSPSGMATIAKELRAVERREASMPEDPTVRALRRQARRTDTADAFLPDPEDGTMIEADDAESFAEEFIATATTGESVEMDALDEVSPDEDGGPYLELSDDDDTDIP